MTEVPTLIRDARERAGFTQAELAERAGTSQPAVARYEAGTVSPSIRVLERLLRACGATISLRVQPASPATLSTAHAKLLRRHRADIEGILRRRGFTSARVFGSTAAGTAGPDSDIDLLVAASDRLDLMNLLGAQTEISDLLGVPVDLATEDLLRPDVRRRVLQEAVPL